MAAARKRARKNSGGNDSGHFRRLGGNVGASQDNASVERAIAGFAEAADLALIIVNQHSRIAFINQATQQMFGHSREAMIGRSLDLIIPRDCAAHTPRASSEYEPGCPRNWPGAPSR
jgi:PAS domain-containing protein